MNFSVKTLRSLRLAGGWALFAGAILMAVLLVPTGHIELVVGLGVVMLLGSSYLLILQPFVDGPGE